MKLISCFSASTAIGVPDSLGLFPGSEIAYLFTGKTPVALNPEVGSLVCSMLQKVVVRPVK